MRCAIIHHLWLKCLLHTFFVCEPVERLFYSLHVETFSTTARSFGIGVGKGEFRAEFGFLPIHGGTHNVEECHGFNPHFDAVRGHGNVLGDRVVTLVHVIEGITESVAAAATDAQTNAERGIVTITQQFLNAFRGALREDNGVLGGRLEGPPALFGGCHGGGVRQGADHRQGCHIGVGGNNYSSIHGSRHSQCTQGLSGDRVEHYCVAVG